jgi:hypothetical protein
MQWVEAMAGDLLVKLCPPEVVQMVGPYGRDHVVDFTIQTQTVTKPTYDDEDKSHQ